MLPFTEKLWTQQNKHPFDRQKFFACIAEKVNAHKVIYPGSYIDIAASFEFSNVVYADKDKRAKKFFDDEGGIREIIAFHNEKMTSGHFSFVHSDYRELALPEQFYDLLISLYAGPISEYCTSFVKIGGFLLVNESHGDVSLASMDKRYALKAVILATTDGYKFSTEELSQYLRVTKSKKNDGLTRAKIIEANRGFIYKTSPFAYLFERVA